MIIEHPHDTDPPWLALALEEANRGVREIPGAEDNPRIVEYWSAIPKGRWHPELRDDDGFNDEIPWCAAFMCFCLEQSGFRSPRLGYARSFMAWGRALDRPERGAIAVFDRAGAEEDAGPKAPGHVAIYLDASIHLVKLVGGNQGNRVGTARYPVSRLLGYRLPAISDRLTSDATGGVA